MKLPAVPVQGFDDATLNAEFLEALGVLGSKISTNAQVTVGTGSLSFAASQVSGAVTVAHGLGRTPVLVDAMAKGQFALIVEPNGSSADATNLHFVGFLVSGAATVTVPFYWVAIG